MSFFFFFPPWQRIFRMCKCAYVAVLIQKSTHDKAVRVENSVLLFWVSGGWVGVQAICSNRESFWNEILLIKSLWYVISSGFRQGILQSACSDLSFYSWDPCSVSTVSRYSNTSSSWGCLMAVQGLLWVFSRAPTPLWDPFAAFSEHAELSQLMDRVQATRPALLCWSSRDTRASCNGCNKECRLKRLCV